MIHSVTHTRTLDSMTWSLTSILSIYNARRCLSSFWLGALS